MLPNYANMAVILDKATGTMKKAEFIPVPDDAECKLFKYDYVQIKRGEKYYFFARYNGMCYEYDLTMPDRVTPHRFVIADNDFKRYLRNSLSTVGVDSPTWGSFVLYDAFVNGDPARFFSTFLPLENDVMKKQHLAFTQEVAAADGSSGYNVFEMCKKSTLG